MKNSMQIILNLANKSSNPHGTYSVYLQNTVNTFYMTLLPGVYVILSCGLRDVFSVALLSAGGGIANADEDAGCDVIAGPPDSSSLGSSCNSASNTTIAGISNQSYFSYL
jgi:hypothetical protein